MTSTQAEIETAAKIFGDYHFMNYPAESFKMPTRQKAQLSIKFIAVCLYAYDNEFMNNPKNSGRMKHGLRQGIAAYTRTNPSLVSQWVKIARCYMRIYIDFKTDVNLCVEKINLFISK